VKPRVPSGGALLVLMSATLWGISGYMVHFLVLYGLSPVQVVYYANGIGAILFVIGLAPWGGRYLAAPWRALPGLLALGVIGGGMSFLLFTSGIALIGVSLTTLLTSTHPTWTTLLAWRFLGEPVDRRRLMAIAAALIGSALVARVDDPGALQANLIGLLFGLGSGVTYAIYNVLGKHVLAGSHPLTVTFYMLTGSALALLAFQPAPLPIGIAPQAVPWLVAFIAAEVVVGPVLYNVGLRVMSAGSVSVIATWELVVGVCLGVLALGEPLDLPQAGGALLVAGSVFILSLTTSHHEAAAAPGEPVAVPVVARC